MVFSSEGRFGGADVKELRTSDVRRRPGSGLDDGPRRELAASLGGLEGSVSLVSQKI